MAYKIPLRNFGYLDCYDYIIWHLYRVVIYDGQRGQMNVKLIIFN